MAVRVGFEPTRPGGLHAFEACAIGQLCHLTARRHVGNAVFVVVNGLAVASVLVSGVSSVPAISRAVRRSPFLSSLLFLSFLSFLPYGAPGPIRTGDLQLRRLPLYPPELPGRMGCGGCGGRDLPGTTPFAAIRLRAVSHPEPCGSRWYAGRDLNAGPLPPQGSALSAELPAHSGWCLSTCRRDLARVSRPSCIPPGCGTPAGKLLYGTPGAI